MASIDISVSQSTGLYSVSIDWNDWIRLTVWDGSSPKQVIPIRNGGASYTQTVAGPLKIQADADTNTIQTVNPGDNMTLQGGTTGNFACDVTFKPQAGDKNFSLLANCFGVPASWEPTGSSPILFSQVHMTGAFRTTD